MDRKDRYQQGVQIAQNLITSFLLVAAIVGGGASIAKYTVEHREKDKMTKVPHPFDDPHDIKGMAQEMEKWARSKKRDGAELDHAQYIPFLEEMEHEEADEHLIMPIPGDLKGVSAPETLKNGRVVNLKEGMLAREKDVRVTLEMDEKNPAWGKMFVLATDAKDKEQVALEKGFWTDILQKVRTYPKTKELIDTLGETQFHLGFEEMTTGEYVRYDEEVIPHKITVNKDFLSTKDDKDIKMTAAMVGQKLYLALTEQNHEGGANFVHPIERTTIEVLRQLSARQWLSDTCQEWLGMPAPKGVMSDFKKMDLDLRPVLWYVTFGDRNNDYEQTKKRYYERLSLSDDQKISVAWYVDTLLEATEWDDTAAEWDKNGGHFTVNPKDGKTGQVIRRDTPRSDEGADALRFDGTYEKLGNENGNALGGRLTINKLGEKLLGFFNGKEYPVKKVVEFSADGTLIKITDTFADGRTTSYNPKARSVAKQIVSAKTPMRSYKSF